MRLLAIGAVQARVGLGRTTLWRLEKNGQFPSRRRVSAGRVMWVESEVDDWIAALPVADPDEHAVRPGPSS